MPETYDPLYLLNAVRTPDRHWGGDKATKAFKGKGGFTGTATAPATLIAMATELWGPMGLVRNTEAYDRQVVGGWGFEELPTEQSVPHEHTCRVLLWYPRKMADGTTAMASVPGFGCTPIKEGAERETNDVYKKSFTDACGNALMRVGFAIDVYMGRFDDLHYVELRNREVEAARVERTQPRVAELRKMLAGPIDRATYDAIIAEVKEMSASEKDALRGAVKAAKVVEE